MRNCQTKKVEVKKVFSNSELYNSVCVCVCIKLPGNIVGAIQWESNKIIES